MNRGANRMARAIQRAARQAVRHKHYTPVLGTIQGDEGLVLDDFPIAVPRGDFLVLEGADVAAGDRVLCIPVGDSGDYVVVGRVT